LSAGENGIALNKKNGKLIWTSNLEVIGSLSSPHLLDHGGKTFAIISDENNINCVDVTNGEKKWSYKYSSYNDPIFMNGKLFLSGDYRVGIVMLELTDGEPIELWKEKSMRGGFQNKVIVGDYVYGFADIRNKQELHCVNLKTGKLMWHENLDARFGALMAANEKLIVINGMGKVIIADADYEGLKKISYADVIPMSDNTGINNNQQCHCWIDPVMVSGKIFVKNNYGNLVCIDATI
jgi:outer membrane protein assembly factor BamB